MAGVRHDDIIYDVRFGPVTQANLGGQLRIMWLKQLAVLVRRSLVSAFSGSFCDLAPP